VCGGVDENCFFASSRLGPVSQRWYMLARASWEKAGRWELRGTWRSVGLSHRWFCVREACDVDAPFVEGVGGCGREEDAPRFFERWPTVAASRVFRIRGGLQDGQKVRSVC